MKRSKHRLGVLAMAGTAAVLGVMAFSVAGAQAAGLPGLSTLGTYLVNLGPALLTPVTMKQVGMTTLSVPARLIEFKCQTSSTLEGKISTSKDAQIQIEYSECLSTFFGVAHACEPENNNFVLKALVLPILHSGEAFLLFEPMEGTVLMVLPWKSEIGCPQSNTPITGSLTASVGTLDAINPLIVFNKEVQLLTGDLLRFGTFPTYMQSHGELELVGEHAGQKLGIH
jgi:hypothetical protein